MATNFRRLTIMFGVPVLLVCMLFFYLATTADLVSTDNAYIKQDKVSVSAEVGGKIIAVNTAENQLVKSGDLLFQIDPQPYQLAVNEADVAVEIAEAHLQELNAALESTKVDIASAQEDIAYFDKEFRRQRALLKNSVTSEAELQTAEHNLASARSKLATAISDQAEAMAAMTTGKSAVRNAKVQLEKAELNLQRTKIFAPVSGVISQANRLQVGQLMMQSLPAVTIVRRNASWVEANFKETDLEHMHTGQPVEISVDTYSDMVLQGKVESIGAGTGSEFAILPAQNASANWVKVTQRVPVRIAIIDKPEQPLIAGLSVNVRVNTSQQ